MLANPLADDSGLEASRASHAVRLARAVRRRTGITTGRAGSESVARHDGWIAIRLRQHPHVRQPVDVAVPVPDPAVALRVVVLEKDNRLLRGHQPPGQGGKLAPGRPVRVELRQPLATRAQELVADTAKLELGDVGRTAGAVRQA